MTALRSHSMYGAHDFINLMPSVMAHGIVTVATYVIVSVPLLLAITSLPPPLYSTRYLWGSRGDTCNLLPGSRVATSLPGAPQWWLDAVDAATSIRQSASVSTTDKTPRDTTSKQGSWSESSLLVTLTMVAHIRKHQATCECDVPLNWCDKLRGRGGSMTSPWCVVTHST